MPVNDHLSGDDDDGENHDVWIFYATLPFIYNEKKLFNINM